MKTMTRFVALAMLLAAAARAGTPRPHGGDRRPPAPGRRARRS